MGWGARIASGPDCLRRSGFVCFGPGKAYAEEDLEDAGGGFDGGAEVAGDLGFAADAVAVADGKFEDAEAVLGGFDLHFEVPAVG